MFHFQTDIFGRKSLPNECGELPIEWSIEFYVFSINPYTLPFYCKKPNEKGGFELFFRYTLFVVMDTHSRKIIGFDVAESENTETILTSLDMAVTI